MKANKINLHWQSFILGIALCAIVVIFLGSKPYAPQADDQAKIDKAVTLSDILAKNIAMEKKLEIITQSLISIESKLSDKLALVESKLDKKLAHIENKFDTKLINVEQKIEILQNGMNSVLKTLDKMWNRGK